jgi:fibronectin-binding autotransporter adhesin
MRLQASNGNKSRRNGCVSLTSAPRFASLSRLIRGGRMTRVKGQVVSCAPHVVDVFGVARPQMFVMAMAAALAASSVGAADLYWDTNASGGGLGGTGDWNTSASVWTQASDGVSGSYAPWNNGQADNAIFAGTAGTVTIGEPIIAYNLDFNVDGYTLTGNTLTLTGTPPTISVATGTATISSAIAGTAGLTKTGPGTLTLANPANTYVGPTTISGGTLQVGGSLSTSTLAMSNASALTVNGTVQGPGGTALLVSGDAGNSTVTVNPGGTLRARGDLGAGSDTLTVGGVGSLATLDTGGGVLGLGAGNDTLVLQPSGNVVSAVVDGGAGTDTIQVNSSSLYTLRASTVPGFEALNKALGGVVVLAGDHTYSAGVTIAAGMLHVGAASTPSSLSANVVNNGTLAFNVLGTYTFGGTVSGSGAVRKIGTGTTVLTGTGSYTGATSILMGTLLIDGDHTAATGLTTVSSGATLSGKGTLGGTVTIANGATLSPGDADGTAGTLTIKGDLVLGATSTLNLDFGRANEVGGTLNDLVDVGGNLTLGGTIQVNQAAGGTFGPGLYRIANYGGTLSDLGTTVSPSFGLVLQKSVAGQVNLVNLNGATLNFWDGDAGPQNNNQINGGSGTWRAAGDFNWTNSAGAFNAPFTNGSMPVFAGTAGTVTVDTNGGAAPVDVAGMQFASNGYVITGDAIRLTGTQAAIRVGDGSPAGAGYRATIGAPLTGSAQLIKTDRGRLVLSGIKTYTGGTRVDEGTLSISSDANLGDPGGALTLNGGTLQTTASLGIGRTVALSGPSTFLTDGGTTAALTGALSGGGALTKDGAGTLILQTNDARTGGTTIAAGTLQVGGGGAVGTLAGNVTNNGTLAFNRSDTYIYNGTIAGTGGVRQIGLGTTVLTAGHSYTGGTFITSGTLQLGAGGTSGMVSGNIVDNGTLAFNRADQITFNGTISGTGSVRQDGAGTTILTAANSYGGATTVNAGKLMIEGDQSLATGPMTVNAGTLGGAGIIGGDVAVAAAATVAPGGLTGAPGTLTIRGGLTLDPSAQLAFNFGQANVVGGPYNDLLDVGGNLTLGGNLTVTQSPGGNFGPGIYRAISYGGAWTDQGLTVASPGHTVQTSVPGQINLVNSAAATLNYWDGDGGPKLNGQVDGGTGTWRVAVGDDNWVDQSGQLNAPYTNGSFTVFAGTGDRVVADNSSGALQTSGMQFASDGYRIEGGDIALVGSQAIVRVGDGTLPGAGYTATIASNLTGSSQLVKEDLGTLVLSGTNTYTGGTVVQRGTLAIASDANLGDPSGALTVADGTLRTTANLSLARPVALTGAAVFLTDPGTTSTLAGTLAGAGSLTKTGAGTLALTDDATHTGGTTIAAGTLQVGAGGTTGTLAGDVTNNGTLAFERSDDVAFAGVISGTGGVAQQGSGTTTLTAANAYTGSTTVNGGTLLVQGDQSLATGAATVNAGTLGGTGIVGGDVAVAGGATLAPGAAPGNPGTFTIKGDLGLNPGANLAFDFGQPDAVGGALNDLIRVGGDLTLGGTLHVTQSAGGSFGPGVYRVIGYEGNLLGGTLALGTLPAGVNLQVQTAIAHQVNVAAAATTPLTYWDGDAGGRNDGQVAGGDGTWRASGDDNWVSAASTTNGAYTNGGFPIFAATGGTVTVDRSQGDVRVSGMQFASNGYTVQGDPIVLEGAAAIVRVGDGTRDGAGYVATINAPLTGGGGLAKADLGTLVLGGSSDYTGAITVAGGTLVVNGSIARSAVSVQNGAVLGGKGTVGTTTVAAGATVAPGTSLGTLSVAGNYAQASGAVYQAQVDPTSNASDRIAVSGTATLADGAVLNVAKTSNAPYLPSGRYTVLTANGGLNGTFAVTGDTAMSSFLGLTAAYDANNAYLVVEQSRAIDTVAQTHNQRATAGGVDSLPISNALKTAVLNLPSDAAARGALDQLSGEIHASVQTASLQDSHFVRDAATGRLRETFCAVGSQSDKREATSMQGEGCGPESRRPSGWVRVFGGWQHTESNGNAGAMSDSTGGLFVGADASVSEHWRVGVMTGYSHTDIDVDSRDSSASTDNYHLGVYGGAQWGALGLRTGAAYTWQDVSTGRSVNFAGFGDSPSASYNAGTAQIFGDLGYRIDAGRYAFEPFVNVAYVRQRTDSFTEDGGAAALHSPGDRSDVTFSTLGTRVSTTIKLGSMEGRLRGSLGWRHAFGDDAPVSSLTFQGGGSEFGVAGVPLARDAAVVEAGLDMSLSKSAVLGVNYSGQFAGSSNAQSVQATLKVMF